MEFIIDGIIYGIAGWVIAEVITMPGQILHPIRKVFKGPFTGLPPSEKKRSIKSYLNEWAFKVTGGCAQCTAGFWALVLSIKHLNLEATFTEVVLAIFTATILNKFL